MRRILEVHIDEDGLSSYGTLYLYDDEDTIREAVKRELFVKNPYRVNELLQEYWYGVSIAEWIKESTENCYDPVNCRPVACATCSKLNVDAFLDILCDRIEDTNTGHQYLFFEFDPLSNMFVTKEF